MKNVDAAVVSGFGEEWARFDQSALSAAELSELFDAYFRVFPWPAIDKESIGADIGCGSGRWAAPMARRCKTLHCIDPSAEALAVARKALSSQPNCEFHLAGADEIPLPDGSLDFAYSLGVLHHVPDTEAALKACVRKLKTGAPLLLYLYYAFDNRPAWFRRLWKASDTVRRWLSALPSPVLNFATDAIAALVYWPLARIATAGAKRGRDVSNWPLAYYRRHSFYVMRNDARDRFGTKLEKRFTRAEMAALMERCGLTRLRFNEDAPFWVAVGYRA